MPDVVVVSDRRLIGDTVRATLRDRGFVVHGFPLPEDAAGLDELHAQLAELLPLTGLLLNEAPGSVELSSALRVVRAVPEIKWVVLTGSRVEELWGAGLDAGALAVLPMTIRVTDLIRVLDQATSGIDVITEEERDRLMDMWRERGAERKRVLAKLEQLTPRESHVLAELRRGHSVAWIAEADGVSVGTVRSHVKAVLRKLEVQSQLAAVAMLEKASELVPTRRKR